MNLVSIIRWKWFLVMKRFTQWILSKPSILSKSESNETILWTICLTIELMIVQSEKLMHYQNNWTNPMMIHNPPMAKNQTHSKFLNRWAVHLHPSPNCHWVGNLHKHSRVNHLCLMLQVCLFKWLYYLFLSDYTKSI